MRRDLLPVLNWTILLVLGYAWLIEGSEGAGNLVKAFCWFAGMLGFLLAFTQPTKPTEPLGPRWSRAWVTWCWLLLALALIWHGHPGYAALLGMTSLGHHLYRENFNADGTLKAKG